jgi:hypothetical protein
MTLTVLSQNLMVIDTVDVADTVKISFAGIVDTDEEFFSSVVDIGEAL